MFFRQAFYNTQTAFLRCLNKFTYKSHLNPLQRRGLSNLFLTNKYHYTLYNLTLFKALSLGESLGEASTHTDYKFTFNRMGFKIGFYFSNCTPNGFFKHFCKLAGY